VRLTGGSNCKKTCKPDLNQRSDAKACKRSFRYETSLYTTRESRVSAEFRFRRPSGSPPEPRFRQNRGLTSH
jgi:hypothetical protein